MKLLFIRHGETEVNVKELTHTQNDQTGLTEKGKEQVRKAADICRENQVRKLFTSPEKRAQETADIIGSELGISPVTLQSLKERNWGDWSGKPWNEIKTALDKMDLEERYIFVPPHGESWMQLEDRLRKILRELSKSEENIAVVMHGGALRALIPLLKNEPKAASLNIDLHNASLTMYEYSHGEYKELLTNDISHLD